MAESNKKAQKKQQAQGEEEDWESDNEEESKGDPKQADQLGETSATILYDILNVAKTATSVEIKKAYRRLALLKHPDKNPNDPMASENFQKLNKAY